MNSDELLYSSPFVDIGQVITFQCAILRIRNYKKMFVTNSYELPVHRTVKQNRIFWSAKRFDIKQDPAVMGENE